MLKNLHCVKKAGSLFRFLFHDPRVRKTACRLILFTFLSCFSELTLQLITGVIGIGFFRVMLFSLLGSALLTLITLPLPKITGLIVTEVLFLTLSSLCISQLIYNHIFHEFFSAEMMSGGGDAVSQFGEILLVALQKNIPGILLLLIPPMLILLLYKLRRYPLVTTIRLKYVLLPLSALLAFSIVLLLPVVTDPFSERGVRYGQDDHGRISSVREVGAATTLWIDIFSGILAPTTSSALKPVPSLPTVTSSIPSQPEVNSETSSDTAISVPPESSETPDWVGKVNGFEIDFDALIERDRGNESLTQLHEYFSSLSPSTQNEHTGIFEGYNLITICAEAFSSYVIDPELTPTLYMMQHEGINFTDFYSIYGGGTIGGEFGFITGLSPRGAAKWCGTAAQTDLPFTLASQFNSIGIQPYAYHSGSYTFYNRNVMFPDLGYDFRAREHGLDIPKSSSWHVSDKEMIELSIGDYIDQERFYVHYMTLSGHSSYDSNNPIAMKNYDKVKDLPYSEPVKAYLASQLELEYALTYLLESLEEAGIAEKTLIVLSPDHFPYGLTIEEISEMEGHPIDTSFELYQNSCIMYVKGMKPEVISSPTFVPDIVPTVSNLLGFSFDSRFLTGRDVFSNAAPFVFLDSGILTNVGVYDRDRGVFTPKEGTEPTENYQQTILDIAEARKSAVEQMVALDYFSQIKEYIDTEASE